MPNARPDPRQVRDAPATRDRERRHIGLNAPSTLSNEPKGCNVSSDTPGLLDLDVELAHPHFRQRRLVQAHQKIARAGSLFSVVEHISLRTEVHMNKHLTVLLSRLAFPAGATGLRVELERRSQSVPNERVVRRGA